MTADQYRKKAQELLSLATSQSDESVQVAYAAMAQSYFRLADMAERNSQTETSPRQEPTGSP